MYSIGRRQFGVSPQFVKKIVQYCTDEKCSAKQYKLRRNRGRTNIMVGLIPILGGGVKLEIIPEIPG